MDQVLAPVDILTVPQRITAAQINNLTMPQRIFAAQINNLTMPQRCALLQTPDHRWRPITVMCEFFEDCGWGASDSWVSWVNAGVIEHIVAADDSPAWRHYLQLFQAGEPSEVAWSLAKHAADEHGLALAESLGVQPSPAQAAFLSLARAYNAAGSPNIHDPVSLRQSCDVAYMLALRFRRMTEFIEAAKRGTF